MNSAIFKYIRREDLAVELATLPKPPAFELQLGYPIGMLSDRQFECLLHDLFKADVVENKFSGKFDNVVLMLGVAERGLDCALLREGKHVGVVQCKRYSELITKPNAAREIIKFALHAIKDKNLMPDPAGFVYIFAASGDFNGKAKELLSDFKGRILRESDLEQWVKEVLDENEGLKALAYPHVRDPLNKILTTIDVQPLNGNEINTKLVGHSPVIQKYFTIKSVISEESVGEIKGMLNSVIGKMTDADVARLLGKLQTTPIDRRFDLGMLSLWGYPRPFLDELIKNKILGEWGLELSFAKTRLDMALLDYLRDRIGEQILSRITARNDISPFTIQGVFQYLVGRISRHFLEKVSGKTMTNEIMKKPEINPFELKQRLLDAGKAVLNNDFSGFAAKGEIAELAQRVSRHIHAEFETVEQMSQRFDADWVKINNIVGQIEREIETLIPTGPVIVVRSLDWFDDKDHLGKIIADISAYDKKKEEPK